MFFCFFLSPSTFLPTRTIEDGATVSTQFTHQCYSRKRENGEIEIEIQTRRPDGSNISFSSRGCTTIFSNRSLPNPEDIADLTRGIHLNNHDAFWFPPAASKIMSAKNCPVGSLARPVHDLDILSPQCESHRFQIAETHHRAAVPTQNKIY